MLKSSEMICPFCNVSLQHDNKTERNFCNKIIARNTPHYREISNEKLEVYSQIIIYDDWLMEVFTETTLIRKYHDELVFDYTLNFKVEIGNDYNQLIGKISNMADLACLSDEKAANIHIIYRNSK